MHILPRAMLSLVIVGMVLISMAEAYRAGLKMPSALRSTTKLLNVAEHSSSFNKFKSAVMETDYGYTIEELQELQKIIDMTIERKQTRKVASTSLHELCLITKEACDAVTPMLQAFYGKISEAQNVKGTEYFEDRTAKLKADATFFSIADGIVQHMFIDFLFQGDKFAQIVGEEDDTVVNLTNRPYTVDDLEVPAEFNELVESTLESIKKLSARIDSNAYKSLTIFCDPIDGTREFATGKGEYCSILIGYNDQVGKPVAGIMYRPLTTPPTWAAGAESENCVMGQLDMATVPNHKGILVTDGNVSPFLNSVIDFLGYEKVNSVASGNRALMLLEGKAGVYIRDTGGFSKWDTSGPQAVLDAYGGVMSKLPAFMMDKSFESYTYLKTEKNLDFDPLTVTLTKANAKDKLMVKAPEVNIVSSDCGVITTTTTVTTSVIASDATMVKEYACTSGLVALDKENLKDINKIHAAMMKAKVGHPPIYT